MPTPGLLPDHAQDLPDHAQGLSIAQQSISTMLPPIPTTSMQYNSMPLPLEAQYASRQALLEAIQAWAKPLGYAFTTGKSKEMESSGRWRVIYACDRFYQPLIYARVRQTLSRGIDCLFSVLIVETHDKLI